MDNPATVVRFVPDRRVTAAAAFGVVVLVVLALVADDGPSRLLFWIGVALLMGFVIGDLAFSPRVEASPAGIVVRSPMLRASLAWPQIEIVRADHRTRLGRPSTTLEIDAGETLAVLSRRALGADPEAAADLINACRPPGSREGGGPYRHHDDDQY